MSADRGCAPMLDARRFDISWGLPSVFYDNYSASEEAVMCHYQQQVNDIVQNAICYHEAFYKAYWNGATFRGPSLYFHRRAVETSLQRGYTMDFDTHAEYIYATLVSWGMHRMGRLGPKMRDHDSFKSSITRLYGDIVKAAEIDYQNIIPVDWQRLGRIFKYLVVMQTDARLVAHSKVMAHLFPDLIPPIDRRYTLMYLNGHTTIKNGDEWPLMQRIISCFFLPIACDPGFQKQANEWMAQQDVHPWDTSVFKVIDNLIIGARLAKQQPLPGQAITTLTYSDPGCKDNEDGGSRNIAQEAAA